MGKPGEALLYKNKYVALNDSMMNAQIQTNIHHLNIQYHSAQKDKKIVSISQRLFVKIRYKVEFFPSFNVNFFQFLTTTNPYLLSIFDCVETSLEGGN